MSLVTHYFTAQNSLYTDLIDEFPTLRYDRVRSVRSWARLVDLKLIIFLDLQCSTDFGPDGRVTSLRVIGLCLSLRNMGRSPVDQPQFLAWLIKTFHSKLAEFPHLRVAEINSDLRLLQWATEAAPDISQLPTLAGGQLTYRWGCPKEDFKSVASEGCVTVGVDPVTLEPSGMCTAYFTSCGETEKCDFQDFFGVTSVHTRSGTLHIRIPPSGTCQPTGMSCTFDKNNRFSHLSWPESPMRDRKVERARQYSRTSPQVYWRGHVAR